MNTRVMFLSLLLLASSSGALFARLGVLVKNFTGAPIQFASKHGWGVVEIPAGPYVAPSVPAAQYPYAAGYQPVPYGQPAPSTPEQLAKYEGVFVPTKFAGPRDVQWREMSWVYRTKKHYNNPDEIHIYKGGKFDMIERVLDRQTNKETGEQAESLNISM